MFLNKVYFPVWDNEIEKTIIEINRVNNQINSVLKKMNKNEAFDLSMLFDNIGDVLERWTGHTYVGIKKEKKIKKAYQYFFRSLYQFLMVCKESEIENMQKIARMVLYQGKAYRYLGHGNDLEFKDKKIKPYYDDIFVSWSKSKYNSYIESKLYGTITIMTCLISENDYGIDLEPFGVVRADEAEVVFPTIEECIIEIEYINK